MKLAGPTAGTPPPRRPPTGSPARPQQMERRGDPVGLGAVVVGQLLHDVAPRPARRDRVDPDAVRREVERLVARQLQDRGLGNRIDPAPDLGDAGGDRAEIDDGALVLGEMRPRRLHQHHRADDVDVERLQPVGARRLRAVVEIGAGDIDQIVEAAGRFDRRRHQRGDVGVAGDVGPMKRALPPMLLWPPASPSASLMSAMTTFTP